MISAKTHGFSLSGLCLIIVGVNISGLIRIRYGKGRNQLRSELTRPLIQDQ